MTTTAAEIRKTIKDTVDDLVKDLLYYGRKEDEDLPVGAIDTAVKAGVVSGAEIAKWFADGLNAGLES